MDQRLFSVRRTTAIITFCNMKRYNQNEYDYENANNNEQISLLFNAL